MGDQSLIIGLLAKREEPRGGNAELRERVAILSNDIEAQDRVSGRTGGLHAPRGPHRPVRPHRTAGLPLGRATQNRGAFDGP